MSEQRIVGLIGGIGPEATIDYYRLIVNEHRRRTAGKYPSIVINSVDIDRVVGAIAAGEIDSAASFVIDEIDRLRRAGAAFAAITTITGHLLFDRVREKATLPLISLLETTRDHIQALGLKRVGLIGTRYTMRGQFVVDVMERAGIAVVIPQPDEQDYVHDKYLGELLYGVFLPETREGLLRVINTMVERDGIDGLILGGTELPLILRGVAGSRVPLIDVTTIHVERIVTRLLEDR